MSNLSLRKPRAGGQWQQGHGGVHQDHGEHDQIHVLHLFQNASIQGCQICHKEYQEQVDRENKDMDKSIRAMVNMTNYMCGRMPEVLSSSGPGQVKVSQGPVKVWSGPGLVQVRSRSSNHYCMICNHVPFISAFKMTVHHCGLPAVPILVLDRASRFFYGSPLWWTCRSPFWLTSS